MNKAASILKSLGALVAGYIVSALLIGVTIAFLGALFPESYKPENTGWVVFNVVYGCIYAVVGGYVTAFAWLAPSRPIAHAIVLGALMAALAVMGLPSIVLGAWLRVRKTAQGVMA